MTSLREAAATFNNIGRLLHDRGRYDEAFQNYRDAISIRASMLRGLRIGADGIERHRQQGQGDSGPRQQQQQQQQQQQNPSMVVPRSGIASTTSTSSSAPVVEHEIAQRMEDATELYRRLLVEEQQLQNHATETTGTGTGTHRQDTNMYGASATTDGDTPSGLSSNHPSREYGAPLDFLSISRHGIERRGSTDEGHSATSRHSLLCPSRPIALYVNEEFARREEEVEGNSENARCGTARPTASPLPSSSSWSTTTTGNQGTGPSTSTSSHPYHISPDDEDYDEYLDSGVTLFNMGLVFSQHPASGNLESAQRLMTMALSVIPPSSSSIYASVLTCQAYVHYREGRLEHAMSSLVQALPILSSNIDQTGPERDLGVSLRSCPRRPSVPTREVSVAIFSLLLRIHYEKGDGSAALENGNVLMHFVTSAFGENSVQAAVVHYNLSLVLFAAGKIEQSFEHGNKFLDLIIHDGHRQGRPFAMISPRGSVGVDPILSEEVLRIFSHLHLRKKMASAIHTLGRLHVEATSVQRGMLLLEQALFLRVKWLAQDDQDVEESHVCVGRIKSDLGIYPSAIFHFKLALGAIEAFVAKHHGGERNTSIAADICGLKTLIAQSYYSHGDLEEALRAYDEVLEILRESNVGNRAEVLSNILSMRGNIQMEMGEVSRAMVSHTHGRYLLHGHAAIPSLICSPYGIFPT